MKIKALGHSRRLTEGYTIRDLELCFGGDHHKIQKWIANGWLEYGLQGTHGHDGNGHDTHHFREKDILELIKRHPQEINFAKVDQVWFLDLMLLRGVVLRGGTASRIIEEEEGQEEEVAALPISGFVPSNPCFPRSLVVTVL